MSAVPNVDYQNTPPSQVDQKQAFPVHDPDQAPGPAVSPARNPSDDMHLVGMLIGCGLFAVALAALVVIPYMHLWLNL